MEAFLERYSRNILLNEVGFEGQKAISHSKILIIGVGGLGCSILPFLASSGVAEIGIIEHQKIELSNLQRQTLYTEADVGNSKLQTAKEFLNDRNSSVKINCFEFQVLPETKEEVQKIAQNYDVIIDATDSFESRCIMNKIAINLGKPFFTGACIGFAGHVYSFNGKPCYSCLFPVAIKEDKTCGNAGIFPPVVGVIGSLIALEVLKFISLKEYNGFGRFILVDFLKEKSFREIIIKQDKKCEICC